MEKVLRAEKNCRGRETPVEEGEHLGDVHQVVVPRRGGEPKKDDHNSPTIDGHTQFVCLGRNLRPPIVFLVAVQTALFLSAGHLKTIGADSPTSGLREQ